MSLRYNTAQSNMDIQLEYCLVLNEQTNNSSSYYDVPTVVRQLITSGVITSPSDKKTTPCILKTLVLTLIVNKQVLSNQVELYRESSYQTMLIIDHCSTPTMYVILIGVPITFFSNNLFHVLFKRQSIKETITNKKIEN